MGGINLYVVLEVCLNWLVGFGGYVVVVGLWIEVMEIDVFCIDFCEEIVVVGVFLDMWLEFFIDLEMIFGELIFLIIEEFEYFVFFGEVNFCLVFCLNGVEFVGEFCKMGGGDCYLFL